MGEEEDDLLRAAEELGIELSGVRADGDGKSKAADEQEEQVTEGKEETEEAEAKK
jgi:DNA-directed RNA polymerase subunit beta